MGRYRSLESDGGGLEFCAKELGLILSQRRALGSFERGAGVVQCGETDLLAACGWWGRNTVVMAAVRRNMPLGSGCDFHLEPLLVKFCLGAQTWFALSGFPEAWTTFSEWHLRW